MISAELIKKIKKLEIRTRHLVNDNFAGAYQAVFKGRGMEFEEVRPYIIGDDVRSIDWNVTARMNQPYIKQFIEERELTIFLAVDASASQNFGSRLRTKKDLTAELAAIIAFSAFQNNDKVGLLIFTDKIEHIVPPQKGKKALLRILRDILSFEAKGKATDISLALETIHRMLKRRCVIFIISDFQDETEKYQRALAILNRYHDCIAFEVADVLEFNLLPVGLFSFEDIESGKTVLVDTLDKGWRDALEQKINVQQLEKKRVMQTAQVDYVQFFTNEDVVDKLVKFFKSRAKRLYR